ncbi:SMI1/KNR4 family protein [Streptomyces flaveolus]|uniref:SMI1/KNR4 family protein n=1 Tax=Streptomyces flaveolus TaxID=67297 RepID=UPI003318B731
MMSHSAIMRLRQILTPPPDGGDLVDWEALTRSGVPEFPSDYREFVEVYGGGEIDEYFAINTPPVSGSPYGELLDGLNSTLADADRDELARQIEGTEVPQVLPFGSTINGDVAFWLRRGNPDAWKVAVFTRQVSYGTSPWSVFEGGMVEFCVAFLTGEVDLFSEASVSDAPHDFWSWKRQTPFLGY